MSWQIRGAANCSLIPRETVRNLGGEQSRKSSRPSTSRTPGAPNNRLPGRIPGRPPRFRTVSPWDLNPIENVWQLLRDNWLSNRVFRSDNDLLEPCCHAWNKVIAHPWQIMCIGLRDWAHVVLTQLAQNRPPEIFESKA
jgi:hypothetical protein